MRKSVLFTNSMKRSPTFRGGEVQGDAPLVDVVSPPEEALVLVFIKGPFEPGGVAGGGLDLDNVGAQVGQHPSAGEPALVSEVQHTIRSQWRRGGAIYLASGIAFEQLLYGAGFHQP